MGTNTKGQQLVQSVSFEVEAIPEENTLKVRSPANMTPVNVKIRVRKKGESDVHKGAISVPRFGPVGSSHEMIRLVSSDQTIMSFNILMEADFERKTLRKPRKRFFGGCLGTSNDDDDGPYAPTNIETRDSKSDTGIVSTKLMLAPNNGDDYASYIMGKKNKKIFGKCKPGGCLDPPFNEDKYSYLPTTLKQPLRIPNDNIVIVENPDEKYIETQIPALGKGLLKKKRESSNTSSLKTSDTADLEDKSVLSLYPVVDKKITLSDNDSDHIITYPTESSTSQQRIVDERKRHSRNSSASKSRRSFVEINTPYFVPPKKDSIKCSSRDEYFKDNNDRNLNTLRKNVTKDQTPKEYRSTKQESTISIKKIITSKPNISRTTDYIEPLRISSHLDEIKKKPLENVGTRSSFSKKKSVEPESNDYLHSEEQRLKELSRKSLSTRSQLPSLNVQMGNLANEQTANVSVRRDMATSLNKMDTKRHSLESNLHDYNLNSKNDVPDIDKNKNEIEKFGSAPKSKLSVDNVSNDFAIHPQKLRMSSLGNQQDNVIAKPDGYISDDLQRKQISAILDASLAIRTTRLSDLNYGKYSKEAKQDKTSKESEFDGEKDITTKQNLQSFEYLDSKDPLYINGLGSSAPNFIKHSNLIENYKVTMDAKAGGRNMIEKIRPKDLSLTANTSDSKLGFNQPKKVDEKIGSPAINDVGNSSASYRKHSSSVEKEKFIKEYGGRNEKEELKPNKLSLATSIYDSKVDLKQTKQKEEQIGPHETGSSGPDYRKHSSLIEYDTFKDARSSDGDEKNEKADTSNSKVDNKKHKDYNVEQKETVNARQSPDRSVMKQDKFTEDAKKEEQKTEDGTPYKKADTSDSKVNYKQHKDYNLEPQETINAGRSPKPNDIKQDKFTEDGKPATNAFDAKDSYLATNLKKRGDYEDVSLVSNAELTLKRSHDKSSAVVLQKDQHPATDKSEMRNEASMVAKRNIPELLTKSSEERDEENKAFSRKTSVDDDKFEINKSGENSIKSANSRRPEVLSDTLQDFPETQQDLTAVREDIFVQNQFLRTTGLALGSDETKEGIIRKLSDYDNENNKLDNLTIKAGIVPDNLNKNIIASSPGTELQTLMRKNAGQDVEMTISKEPTGINKITVDRTRMQKETNEGGGAIIDIKTSFGSKDSFQDEYSKKREIARILKETDSNKSVNHFDGFLNDRDMQETYYHNIIEDNQRLQNEMKLKQKDILFKQNRSNDRDSIFLDLALTSFSNAQDEIIVKSLETSVDTKLMNNVVVVKTTVKSDSKGIRIPIDYDNYMSIKIKKVRKESDRNKSESSSLDHVVRKVDSRKLDLRPRANILKNETVVIEHEYTKEPGARKEVDNNMLQETLTCIYEKELIPLQNTIKSLKDDIDILAEQQKKYRDTVHGVKVLRSTRLVHSNKRCGCIRK